MQSVLAVQEPAHPVKHPVAELARGSVVEAVTVAVRTTRIRIAAQRICSIDDDEWI